MLFRNSHPFRHGLQVRMDDTSPTIPPSPQVSWTKLIPTTSSRTLKSWTHSQDRSLSASPQRCFYLSSRPWHRTVSPVPTTFSAPYICVNIPAFFNHSPPPPLHPSNYIPHQPASPSHSAPSQEPPPPSHPSSPSQAEPPTQAEIQLATDHPFVSTPK